MWSYVGVWVSPVTPTKDKPTVYPTTPLGRGTWRCPWSRSYRPVDNPDHLRREVTRFKDMCVRVVCERVVSVCVRTCSYVMCPRIHVWYVYVLYVYVCTYGVSVCVHVVCVRVVCEGGPAASQGL